MPAKPHSLPAPLIVSLTSYPKRFGGLATALKSLLAQRTRPDAVILWILREDASALPKPVLRLTGKGLTIRVVDVDTRSYKKLVPAVAEYAQCFIATADDDVVYASDWLSQLVDGIDLDRREVVGLRGRWIQPLNHGASDHAFAPYESWPLVDSSTGASERVVLTGVGGILYPPGCFGPEVTDMDRFLGLCPRADDLWFYFQLRKNGYVCRKVGDLRPLETVAGSQEESLWSANRSGENDQSWYRLVRAFGNPLQHPTAPDPGDARKNRSSAEPEAVSSAAGTRARAGPSTD